MKNEKIIEAIVDKINAGYDDYGIEKFLEHQEINSDEFDTLIEAAKNIILEHKLQTYPKQNKSGFIVSLALFIMFFLFFGIILPSLNIASGIIPLSILGAICVSLSGFYVFMYYKSWEKSFIEREGKPEFDLVIYFVVSSIPTILFYGIIYGSFLNGSGYTTNQQITIRLLKHLIP
ncbi:MAG TPA: hypothetical protein VIV55_00430 [Flavobacterium sp.]